MHVISLEVENFKRLTAVSITPDGSVVEITGKNGAGKSSVLDAIWAAIGGADAQPAMPVHAGEEIALIKVDLGRYKVTRKFIAREGKPVTTSITVENEEGARFQQPQTILNGLVSALTFDPLDFVEMKPGEQVAALRALVPGVDFDALEKANKQDHDDRADVNRQHKLLLAQAAGLDVPEGAPKEKVDVSDLVAQLNAINEANSALERRRYERDRVLSVITSLENSIAADESRLRDLENEISALGKRLATKKEDLTNTKETAEAEGEIPAPASTVEIQQRIDGADGINSVVEKAIRRAAIINEADALDAQSKELTDAIDARKKDMENAVKAADLPVEGLTFDADCILLNGIPFSQSSQADQVRVSMAIADAMNPELKVVRIKQGAFLDSDSMGLVKAYADEHGLQVWIETIESSRPSAVQIVDGSIARALEAAE